MKLQSKVDLGEKLLAVQGDNSERKRIKASVIGENDKHFEAVGSSKEDEETARNFFKMHSIELSEKLTSEEIVEKY